MKRLFMSGALSAAWLLNGMLSGASAQVVVSSPTPASRDGSVLVMPLRHAPAAQVPVAVPPSLPVAVTAAPASPAPRLERPVYQMSPNNPNEYIVTLSVTDVAPPVVQTMALGTPVAPPRDSALPPSGSLAKFPRAERGPERKSFVDLSAARCFAHAPDYNWIFGQVEYSNVSKEWRLRYASVEEEDRYGGRVSLIENHYVKELREGMYIHARGYVVNPENSSTSSTYFRIDWYRALENPNAEPTESDRALSGVASVKTDARSIKTNQNASR